jgi:hypothetical protein
LSDGDASVYIAYDPRTRSGVVEKSKKMAAALKKPAEKNACCGEGHFQPRIKTFISNNLRTS